MARQESAAAGRDDGSAGDVVIVGESRLPVAVMRQPSPWLAVDDTDEEDNTDDDTHDSKQHDGGTKGGGGGRGTGSSRKSGCRTTTRRRGSFDESEDPATAISVVSEQLWGLQQKLVGTYMAVARARLGRGFPAQFPFQFPSDPGHVSSPAGASGRQFAVAGNGGSGGAAGRKKKGAGGRGDAAEAADGPDEETRVELAAGALDSLCAAWEHLAEAMITLDRRAAGALACEEAAAKVGRNDDDYADGETAEAAVVERKGNAADNENGRASVAQNSKVRSSRGGAAQEQRAENLGPLWAGSLSEALARSGGDADATVHKCHGANDGKFSGADGGAVADVTTAGVNENGGKSGTSAAERDGDVTRSIAWDRAARRQLEVRRVELFELCGDIAHACFSLRTAAARGAPAAAAATTRSNRTHDALGRLLPRLEGLLASARPSLVLADMDVCRGLHRGVCRALLGSEKDGSTTSHQADDDPPPLKGMCIHSLAKGGHVPGDATAWSLCLAAEACYEEALVHLVGTCTGGGDDLREADCAILTAVDGRRSNNNANQKTKDRTPKWSDKITGSSFDVATAMVIEADARLRRKVGDASNELGKLVSHCAGVLVQAPVPQAPPSQDVQTSSPVSTENTSSSTTSASSNVVINRCRTGRIGPPHPGLACAVCVACAEGRFRRSLKEFRAIDDARNSALLLCNLASVERLKPRALARLREACPEMDMTVALGGGGNVWEVTGGSRHDGVGPKRLQGKPTVYQSRFTVEGSIFGATLLGMATCLNILTAPTLLYFLCLFPDTCVELFGCIALVNNCFRSQREGSL